MSRAVPRPAAPVLLAVLALAGCGGAKAPEEVALDYVRSDDPAKCEEASPAFLERQTRRRGAAARQACERAVRGSDPPDEVEVVDEEVRGDRAEVRLEADTQDVLVTLERRGDDWLVSGLGS